VVKVEQHLADIDQRLDGMDRRIGSVESDLTGLRMDTKAGFESMYRLMAQGIVALTAAYLVGSAALIGLVATQV
jgi:hypothetical protein